MLTDTQIKAAKAQLKAYTLSDDFGLYLFVQPNGSKWWRLRYTHEGRRNMMSIGVYPDISLLQARERRDAARKLIAQGIDPVAHKRNLKSEKLANQANTFEVWAVKWWNHWRISKSTRHAEYVKRRLEADVYPFIGKRPISDIDGYEIVDTVKNIAARGALDMAKRCHQTIGQVFRYAIAHGKESKVTRNPAADIKPGDIIENRPHKNYARIDVNELPDLLRAIDNSPAKPTTRLAVKLLALTFVRTSELIGASWSEFDLESALWRIPAERMKKKTPHIVPLAKQTLEILKTLRQFKGNSDLLFYNRNDHSKPMSNNTILKALETMGYKGRMTGHGFRGLASTQLNELGYDEKHIELQLAHLVGNATKRAYDHAKHLPDRAIMMQAWADYLDQVAQGAKIIPLNHQLRKNNL